MKRFYLSFCLAFVFVAAFAQLQPTVKQWDYRYGGTGFEYTHAFVVCADSGFLMVGFTTSGHSGGDITTDSLGGVSDGWIIKLDSLGQKQWEKRYGGNGRENFETALQTPDGGFLLAGNTDSDSSRDIDSRPFPLYSTDGWVVKIDAQGNTRWGKRLGGLGFDFFTSACNDGYGGYYLLGSTSSAVGYDVSQAAHGGNWPDLWLVHIDSTGHKLWDRNYGGINEERPENIITLPEGGVLLLGLTFSDSGFDVSQPTRDTTITGGDYWIVRIDSAGNKLWDKRFGGRFTDVPYAASATDDGGFLIAGTSNSPPGGDISDTTFGITDYWLVRIDSNGNKLWDKHHGGNNYDDDLDVLQPLPNGNFLVSGTSYSSIGADKSETNLGPEQSWMLMMDSAGNRIWDKTILTAAHDEDGFAYMLKDGCYVIANQTQADTGGYKSQDSRGGTDVWIVKFCPQACNAVAPVINANQYSFCPNDSAAICAPPGYHAYHWNTGEDTSCIYAKQAGNYYVAVTDSNGCSVESNHLALTVLQPPPVSISVKGDTLSAFNAETYQWYLNGHLIPGATSSVYIATQSGSYTVQVSDTNGCYATSLPSVITVNGIHNLTESFVSVYPNPSPSGNFTLLTDDEWLNSSAQIFDENGRKVYTNIITSPHQQIDLGFLPCGVYTIQLKSSKSSLLIKLMK